MKRFYLKLILWITKRMQLTIEFITLCHLWFKLAAENIGKMGIFRIQYKPSIWPKYSATVASK